MTKYSSPASPLSARLVEPPRPLLDEWASQIANEKHLAQSSPSQIEYEITEALQEAYLLGQAGRLVDPSPRQKNQEDVDPRVGPPVDCAAPVGSTAELSQGVQSPPVGEKRLPWRLGCMADAMVSAKVGPHARFFSRERVDEIVLLLREAEKFILEGMTHR